MKLRISVLPLIGASMIVASSSIAPAKDMERSPEAAQKLAQALEGRAAGAPVNCISNFLGRTRMQVIDDQTIIFKDGAVVYVQQPPNRCDRLENRRYSLVLHQYGSQNICSGDINQMIDGTTGVFAGSCVFGPFVPYRKTG